MVIEFYSPTNAYGAFSNFSKHSVRLDGKTWPTSEHYFQAMKFEGTIHERMVRIAYSAGEAARIGRDRGNPLRKDWESVKNNIMRKAVYAKFTQHDDLRELLLSTGDKKLVEHTERDSYWGDGGDGSGKNMLGVILMETRTRIRIEDKIDAWHEAETSLLLHEWLGMSRSEYALFVENHPVDEALSH